MFYAREQPFAMLKQIIILGPSYPIGGELPFEQPDNEGRGFGYIVTPMLRRHPCACARTVAVATFSYALLLAGPGVDDARNDGRTRAHHTTINFEWPRLVLAAAQTSNELRDQLRAKMREHLRDYYGEGVFDTVAPAPNAAAPAPSGRNVKNNDTAANKAAGGGTEPLPAPVGRTGVTPLEEALMQMRRAEHPHAHIEGDSLHGRDGMAPPLTPREAHLRPGGVLEYRAPGDWHDRLRATRRLQHVKREQERVRAEHAARRAEAARLKAEREALRKAGKRAEPEALQTQREKQRAREEKRRREKEEQRAREAEEEARRLELEAVSGAARRGRSPGAPRPGAPGEKEEPQPVELHPAAVHELACEAGRCFVRGVQVSLGPTSPDKPLDFLVFCRDCPDPHIQGSLMRVWRSHYGPQSYHVDGVVAYAVPNDARGPLLNDEHVRGHIALVDRGTVPFVEKVLRAQEAGAVAVIILDRAGEHGAACGEGFNCGPLGDKLKGGFAKSDDWVAWRRASIPAVLVSERDAERLRGLLELETMQVPGWGPQVMNVRP